MVAYSCRCGGDLAWVHGWKHARIVNQSSWSGRWLGGECGTFILSWMNYRHVAITGASSGIGAAIARDMSAAGLSVTLVARRREAMEALAQVLPGRSHIAVCDLAQVVDATSWIADAERALGPVDILVNNAGVQVIGPATELDVERGERSVAVNLLSPLRLVRALLPGMTERRCGAIVNIASLAALAPTPGMTYYNASKAGIASASEALRGELLRTPIQVVTVYPGIIETDMGRAGLAAYGSSKAISLQPRGTVGTLARKVRQAVIRGDARVIYPGVYRLARLLPGVTRFVIDRMTPGFREP